MSGGRTVIDMGDLYHINHVVITPCRDEIEFLPDFATSVINQTILPLKWVIVSDNSETETNQFLTKISIEHDWITVLNIDDGKKRKRGKHIAKLVNFGISSIRTEWDFLSKIDSDMVLPSDYFERLFVNFMNSEKLGIASGNCFIHEKGKKKREKAPRDHTRGGLKTYRRQCYDDIDGIREMDGWDGIDNVIAQMEGWSTRSFDDLEVLHQRRTGSHSGLLKGCFEAGQFAYGMGYYPPFMLARSFHRMLKVPFVIGGIAMIMGYCSSLIKRKERNLDVKVVTYLRNKQKVRMMPFLQKRFR